MDQLSFSSWLPTDGLEMVVRLLAALAAGAMIGYERSYHGRPAGFRTHALVCTASCLLMFVTVQAPEIVPGLTIRDVAAPDSTQLFLLIGIGLNIPLLGYYTWFAQRTLSRDVQIRNEKEGTEHV